MSLDFGAFPGNDSTTVAVTGQTGIVAGSLVEAWLRPETTADHTADEHMIEQIRVSAGDIVAGTGFTVYGWCTYDTPQDTFWRNLYLYVASPITNNAPRLYGVYSVAWVWNT